MTGVLKRELETIVAIFAVTAVMLLILMHNKKPQQQHVIVPTLPNLLTTPTPTTPALPSSQTFNAVSPDGSKMLFMKKQPGTQATAYTFSVSTSSDGTKELLYKTSIDNEKTYFIPFNTWSPDNKYVFVKKETPSGNEYEVLSVDSQSQTPITIADKFAARYSDLMLTDVTGWAAPYLLIVNTRTLKGEQGPSFWFDISSESFIQLSTRFN